MEREGAGFLSDYLGFLERFRSATDAGAQLRLSQAIYMGNLPGWAKKGGRVYNRWANSKARKIRGFYQAEEEKVKGSLYGRLKAQKMKRKREEENK